MSTTYGLHRAMLLNRNGTAVVFEDRRRTFAELADRVARLAGALKALGRAGRSKGLCGVHRRNAQGPSTPGSVDSTNIARLA